MSEGGSVAGNTARLLSAQVAANTGYFVAVLLLARALTPAGRGTVAFITVTALVTARIASFGLTEATKVFAAKRPGARAELLSTAVVAIALGALTAAALVCGALAVIPVLTGLESLQAVHASPRHGPVVVRAASWCDVDRNGADRRARGIGMGRRAGCGRSAALQLLRTRDRLRAPGHLAAS